MNPFDINTDWGHKLAQHIPLLGMVAVKVQESSRTPVEFWHLVVAMIGLGVLLGSTLGTIIWNESKQTTELTEQLKAVRLKDESQDSMTAYIQRRQEIDEDIIHQLQTDSALLKENDARMIREHAEIYQAIRGMRR